MKKSSTADDNSLIINEIRLVNGEIEKAYESFQSQTDSDLMEASIYRIKELRARQNYLIRTARENNVEALYMKFRVPEKVTNA